MYLPENFLVQDRTRILEFLDEYSFASVVSQTTEGLEANHYPLIPQIEQDELWLFGHMAKANPQWKSQNTDDSVLCIFNGPHSYISPALYVKKPNVPTWNYATIHATGKLVALHDEESLKKILRISVEKFEKNRQNPWNYDVPESFHQKLLAGIVGFKIKVEKLEAKFKLSQNRLDEDYLAVFKYFEQSSKPEEQALFKLMTWTKPT